MRSPPTSLFLWAALGLVLLTAPAAAAEASTRALLIGVGDYPALPARLHLAASAGDVRRLRTALLAAGLQPGAITVMTERDGERPTRAAILAALERLARTATPGERVLIYFSGHGAQAPARRPEREPDGLEELYLAADAARWDGAIGAVPGAIADFELEAAIDAVRRKGADVWFVADACHAAGLTRGAQSASLGEGRAKTLSAADLGVPGARLRGSRADEVQPLQTGAARGGFAGFYAAAPGALAVERRLPAGAADAEPASVFTFALVQALSEGRTRTFRDLAGAISAFAPRLGAAGSTPVFEGALDGSVLDLPGQPRRYEVRHVAGAWRVDAGVLEGFAAGREVELLRGSESVGRTVVTASGLAEARLAPLAELQGVALLASPTSPAGLGGAADTRGARLLEAAGARSGDGAAAGLKVEAALYRKGCGENPPAAQGLPPQAVAFDPAAAPTLRHCDVVYLRLSNTGPAPIDVSPLYLDSSGRIAALGLAPQDEVRIEPGGTRFAAVRLLTRDARGRPLAHGAEQLVLLAAPATRADRKDLRSLADPTLRDGAPEASLDAGVGARVYAWRVAEPPEF